MKSKLWVFTLNQSPQVAARVGDGLDRIVLEEFSSSFFFFFKFIFGVGGGVVVGGVLALRGNVTEREGFST